MTIATFKGLYTPKLITVLREGYRVAHFKADLVAGLTVAVVALPLSMAIAIASGVPPDRGIWTAIVGGFLVSLLGGSRFQIGGPAGAFIVLVAATVATEGIDGLILATFMSGLLMMAAGFLRLGTFIKFIPFPVTVGFTAGIAVIIFVSQIHQLLGLVLANPEPGPVIPKIVALWQALPTISPAATGVALLTIALIFGLRRLRPSWPDMLIALTILTLATAILKLPLATIGSEFGGIARTIPAPHLPEISLARLANLLPDALAFTLLGSIESLLSAVVADSMTGRRHRSNCELVAQGVANIGSALIGGFCVTGTIARTATNVRAGAHGPVAGMIHALALLGVVLIAAPLAAYIPLAALAGVLATVAWNMADRFTFASLLRSPSGDAVVLLTTFLLTVFYDLTSGIIAGFTAGSLLFIYRMSQRTYVREHHSLIAFDEEDQPRPELAEADAEVITQYVRGALFFGASSTLDSVLDRIGAHHKVLILDLEEVPFIDVSGANAIRAVADKARRNGTAFFICGVGSEDRRVIRHVAPQILPEQFQPSSRIAREIWDAQKPED